MNLKNNELVEELVKLTLDELNSVLTSLEQRLIQENQMSDKFLSYCSARIGHTRPVTKLSGADRSDCKCSGLVTVFQPGLSGTFALRGSGPGVRRPV